MLAVFLRGSKAGHVPRAARESLRVVGGRGRPILEGGGPTPPPLLVFLPARILGQILRRRWVGGPTSRVKGRPRPTKPSRTALHVSDQLAIHCMPSTRARGIRADGFRRA